MEKKLLLILFSSVLLYACLPALPLSPAPAATSLSEQDLRDTAEVFSRQTLQALPTVTSFPSQTPVVMTATSEELPSQTLTLGTQGSLSETTATASDAQTGTPSTATITTSSSTTTLSPITGSPAPTNTAESLHPRFYGTLPPNLPSGEITLVNKSKSEAYISMQCTTQDGYVTIIEYPVKFKVVTSVPSGKCKIVGWVGGVKMTGGFSLSSREAKTINIFKDRIEVK
ncbi:MAG: hypothetical protein FJZ87_11900 [Chloroflexi bacterium]|nr:hypothetical protein [Chloroflexota bacterium]